MAAPASGVTITTKRGGDFVSSTYAPRAHLRTLHVNPRVVAVGALAIALAMIAGYAIAGGFGTDSAPGQDVADRVSEAWATGDAEAIAAAYAPTVQVKLVYDGREDVIASNIKEITAAINGAKSFGNTYKQVGPVSYYETDDGASYVAATVEVMGPGHPVGTPLIGFYRVENGKVTRQIFFDAEHY